MEHYAKLGFSIWRIVLVLFFGFGSLGTFVAGSAAETVFYGAKIYTAPDAAPIENGVIVISGGKIAAVGSRRDIQTPSSADQVDVTGKIITAGLWNSHVHFSLPPLKNLTNDKIQSYVTDMLLQYGFVHVLDTGSLPGVTTEIRRRIEVGEMIGPTIIIAGGSLVPKGATPFYVRPTVMPDAAPPSEAQAQVDMVLGFGMDGIKIFSGSILGFGNIAHMDADVVRGVTEAAHNRGAFVVSHPTTSIGAWAAINGGVDILAHTFPEPGWDRSIPAAMVESGMALIPTLKLWRYDGERQNLPENFVINSTPQAQEQLVAFSRLGGQVLFGTDVGYMMDFDPTEEYVLMQDAGLSFAAILSSLTTSPASRFGLDDQTGRLEVGMDADLVVLSEDPAEDTTAFARPFLVMRQGQVIFERRP